MPTATVNGLSLAYEVIGDWASPGSITPGGRFTKESPGVRELAEALAEQGNKVLIWDRPNCGESDVCFEGPSESAMQADALAGLLTHLDMTPAVIAGGSGGARVSLLTAARHPETAAGLAIWWISGGVYGLLSLATHYCGGSLAAAWTRRHGGGGRPARVGGGAGAQPVQPGALPGAGPGRVHRHDGALDAGLLPPRRRARARVSPDADARALDIPALVFRSGESDAAPHAGHLGGAGRDAARTARLVEPPWGDREWIERQEARDEGLFARWPLLAPQLLEWQAETFWADRPVLRAPFRRAGPFSRDGPPQIRGVALGRRGPGSSQRALSSKG